MFLTSEAGNFLIIAIIAVFVIALALVIYLLLTTKKKDNEEVIESSSNEFGSQNSIENNIHRVESSSSEIVNQSNIENNMHTIENLPSEIKEETNVEQEFNIIQEPKKVDNNLEENIIDNSEHLVQNDLADEKTETDIESVLKEMKRDLDSLEKNEEVIAKYEEDEEKNAIISYKELMKYKDAQDKDIILEDKDKSEIKEIIENNPNTVKKFKRSEFISPIFGYNDDSNVTYREIKRPPRKEKIKETELEWESDRILKDLEDNNTEVIEFEEKEDSVDDNTTRFLDELVDFRKKLD